jgi:hypothetical protein
MSSKPTQVAVAVLLAAVTALAAGCGGGTKTATQGPAHTTPTKTNGGGSGAEPAFASPKNCRAMSGMAAKAAAALEANPGNSSKALQTEAAELQTLTNAAPSAIKGDLQTFSTAFSSFLGTLQKSGYNVGSKTPPTAAQAATLAKAVKSLETAKLKQAEQHLGAWARQNCSGVHVGG